MKQPPTRAELEGFVRALGSVRPLVKPTMRKALEPKSDAEVFEHLVATPGDLRRPIIVRGKLVLAGFDEAAREALSR